MNIPSIKIRYFLQIFHFFNRKKNIKETFLDEKNKRKPQSKIKITKKIEYFNVNQI